MTDDPFLAQLEASREPDERLGEAWLTLTARCSFATEPGHPEESEITVEDVAFYDIALLLHRGWSFLPSDGWLCPSCVRQSRDEEA